MFVNDPTHTFRLAESLECLLPYHEHQGQPNILGNYQRQALFQVYILILCLLCQSLKKSIIDN